MGTYLDVEDGGEAGRRAGALSASRAPVISLGVCFESAALSH
jgi:hypothetical protein